MFHIAAATSSSHPKVDTVSHNKTDTVPLSKMGCSSTEQQYNSHLRMANKEEASLKMQMARWAEHHSFRDDDSGYNDSDNESSGSSSSQRSATPTSSTTKTSVSLADEGLFSNEHSPSSPPDLRQVYPPTYHHNHPTSYLLDHPPASTADNDNDWLAGDLGIGTTEKRAFASAYNSLINGSTPSDQAKGNSSNQINGNHPNGNHPNGNHPNGPSTLANGNYLNGMPMNGPLVNGGPPNPTVNGPPNPAKMVPRPSRPQVPMAPPPAPQMTLLSGQDNLKGALVKIGQLFGQRLPPQVPPPPPQDEVDAMMRECQDLEELLWSQVFNVIQDELKFKQSPFFRNCVPPPPPAPPMQFIPPPPPGLLPTPAMAPFLPPPPPAAKWVRNESQQNWPNQYGSQKSNWCNSNVQQKWA